MFDSGVLQSVLQALCSSRGAPSAQHRCCVNSPTGRHSFAVLVHADSLFLCKILLGMTSTVCAGLEFAQHGAARPACAVASWLVDEDSEAAMELDGDGRAGGGGMLPPLGSQQPLPRVIKCGAHHRPTFAACMVWLLRTSETADPAALCSRQTGGWHGGQAPWRHACSRVRRP